MANYKFECKDEITLEDYSNLEDYMELISEKDRMLIILNKTSEKELKIFECAIKNKNFIICDKFKNSCDAYYMEVGKK